MELVVVAQRPGEPNEQWRLRNRWANRALLCAADLSSGDRLRGSAYVRFDWNDDSQVLNSSSWPLPEAVEEPASPFRKRPASPERPPWEQGVAPAPVVPFTLSSPRAAELETQWGSLVAAQVLIPPDVRQQQVPIWSIPTPDSVHPVDPASAPFDFDFEAHAAASLAATLAEMRSQANVSARQLPMQYENVWKHLKRGAELTVDGGRWVVKKAGSHVLGPVGLVGDIYDAYRFLRWVWEKQLPPTPAKPGEPFAGAMPRTYYDIHRQQVMFWWPSGEITPTPRNWSL